MSPTFINLGFLLQKSLKLISVLMYFSYIFGGVIQIKGVFNASVIFLNVSNKMRGLQDLDSRTDKYFGSSIS